MSEARSTVGDRLAEQDKRLEQLRAEAAGLAAPLTEAVERLAADGIPLPERLLTAAADHATAHRQLAGELGAGESAEALSYEALAALLERRRAEHEARHERQALTHFVDRLVTSDPVRAAALAEFRAQAHARLADESAGAAALDAVRRVRELIDQRLDSSVADTLYETVATDFSTSLALGIMTGQITSPAPESAEAPAPEAAEATAPEPAEAAAPAVGEVTADPTDGAAGEVTADPTDIAGGERAEDEAGAAPAAWGDRRVEVPTTQSPGGGIVGVPEPPTVLDELLTPTPATPGGSRIPRGREQKHISTRPPKKPIPLTPQMGQIIRETRATREVMPEMDEESTTAAPEVDDESAAVPEADEKSSPVAPTADEESAAAAPPPETRSGAAEPGAVEDSRATPVPAPEAPAAGPLVEPVGDVSTVVADTPADAPAEAVAEPVPSTPWEAACALARAAREREESLTGEAGAELVWQLLAASRSGLAHGVASTLAVGSGAVPVPPPWLLEALPLAAAVAWQGGPVAQRLGDLYLEYDAGLFVDGAPEANLVLRLLCAAAAMRPALVAPGCGAASLVLDDLRAKDGLIDSHALWQQLVQYASNGVPVDPAVLHNVEEQESWSQQCQDQVQRIADWLAEAPRRTIRYQAATDVFRNWVRPDGLLHRLLAPVVARGLEGRPLDALYQQAEALSKSERVAHLIRETDRELRGSVTSPIVGPALTRLKDLAKEAVGMLEECQRLQQARPAAGQQWMVQQLSELRTAVQRLAARSREEVAAAETLAPDSLPLAIAAQFYRESLAQVDAVFNLPEGPVHEPAPEWLGAHELACLPWAIRGESPYADGYTERAPDELLAYLAAGGWGPDTALQRCTTEADHEASGQLLQALEAIGSDPAELADLGARRAAAVTECQARVAQRLGQVRRLVEEAAPAGALSQDHREWLLARLADLERDGAQRYGPVLNELQSCADEVEEASQTLRQEFSQVVLDRKLPDDLRRRFLEQIATADLLTAGSLVERLQAGEDLDEVLQPARGQFAGFFPDFHREVARFLKSGEDLDFRALTEQLRNGHDYGPFRASRLPDAGRRNSAADLIEQWFELKRSLARAKPETLRKVLEGLEFAAAEMPVKAPESGAPGFRRHEWFTVRVAPIAEAETCRLPSHGSVAAGEYQLLLLWSQPTEEVILDELRRAPQQQRPVLLFYLGRLGEQGLRDLAAAVKRSGQSAGALVLDDTLLLHIAMQPKARLRTFFAAGLPLTASNPYTKTGSRFEPEMFYGRQRESREIADPKGPSLVYGGRQLGKTVMLRSVARAHDLPEQGSLALYLSLVEHQIGTHQPPEAIWGLLTSEFRKREIGVRERPVALDARQLLEDLEAWLRDNPSRRILLLLDEADEFLRRDGEPSPGTTEGYREVSLIKGLMDRTDGRFKVVFAGLHNVQRFAQGSNSPLAHLDAPISVGPLLDHGEWHAAVALIVEPLRALGFEIAPAAVWRILSLTNFYPNLIQIFCHDLLNAVQGQSGGLVATQGPPWRITTEQVDAVYASANLREQIVTRLDWTLQLDLRYKAITYAIARASLAGNGAMSKGIPAGAIVEQARAIWPQGFASTLFSESEALLSELVDLGILRQTRTRRFALRNSNVLSLLGPSEDIAHRIEALQHESPPEAFNPARFRRALEGEEARISPFTFQEESVLLRQTPGHQVAFVFGTPALGLDRAAEALEPAAQSGGLFNGYRRCDAGLTGEEFSRSLDRWCSGRGEGLLCIVVPPGCAWDWHWVAEARAKLERLVSQERAVRIVFVGDAARALVWEREWFDQTSRWPVAPAVVHLGRWHADFVRQWLDRLGVGGITGIAEQLEGFLGNWPWLLDKFHDLVHKRGYPAEQAIEMIDQELTRPAPPASQRQGLGLEVPALAQLVQALHDLGEPGALSDLAGVVDDPDGHDLEPVMDCARHLGLVDESEVDPARYVVNSIVAGLLRAGSA